MNEGSWKHRWNISPPQSFWRKVRLMQVFTLRIHPEGFRFTEVLKEETEEPQKELSIQNLSCFPSAGLCKRWLEAAAALSSLLMLLIASEPLLLLAGASSSRKDVFVFLKLQRRNFYQSDQSRGAEEITRPPCLLLFSAPGLHFTSCMLG